MAYIYIFILKKRTTLEYDGDDLQTKDVICCDVLVLWMKGADGSHQPVGFFDVYTARPLHGRFGK